MSKKKLFPTQEVSDLSGLDEPTLRTLYRTGVIDAQKLGGAWFTDRDGVEMATEFAEEVEAIADEESEDLDDENDETDDDEDFDEEE